MANKTRATIHCRDALEAERGKRLGEASALYEKASEIYEGLCEHEQAKDNLVKAARCLEEDKRELDRAAGLFLRLEMYADAGRILMMVGSWRAAAEAFILAGDEDSALRACYKAMDPAMAEDLVLSRGPGDKAVRDKWLDNFCYRLKDQEEQEGTVLRLLGLMSGPDPKRKFLKRKRMFHELRRMEEELGNFVEAARLAETIRDFAGAARCYGQLGLTQEVCMIDCLALAC